MNSMEGLIVVRSGLQRRMVSAVRNGMWDHCHAIQAELMAIEVQIQSVKKQQVDTGSKCTVNTWGDL